MSEINSDLNVNIDINAGGALAAIKALQSRISDFHTSLAKGSATANLKSLQMQQSLIDTLNATGQFSAQMKTVASSTQTFTTALEKNKLSMGQYFKYAGGASKSFGRFFKTEMDTIQKVAIERVKDLQTQYIKMGRDANGALKTIAVRPLALDMKNLATQTQIAAQKQQLLNQLLKQGSTNLLNFGKNTQWAGRQLMVGFTIPLGILGTTAARTFMDMEKQAIAFKRVYGDTFTASKETDAMLKQVQQLASEFTKYGVAVEKTMEQAAKAAATGKMGADLLAQVSEATRLSVLGNVEQAQALETTISLTNAFGTAADELRGKINFLNAVENQTVTSIEDLTIAIPKAAPVIKQLGGNVEDLTFFLTAMREGGINASESANALKSGLASLINPTKKASDFLQGFGININKIVEGNKGDVQGLVVDFAKALDTLDPLNRARAIEQLFGKFQFSRLSTLFQNVIKDGSQAARVLELTRQSSAELGILAQRELNRIASSPMYKFEKAVADFKKELAPVGEEFLKAVTPIINFATDVLKAFNNLDGGVKQFIVNSTGLIAGIGPVFLMTFGLLANGVANIIKGFTFVKNVFNKAASASTILGETTDYMTQQQLEAATVAASLEQVHNKLTQAFTSETSAVNSLTAAYQKAVNAQVAFSGPPSAGKRAPKPKKYADGVFSVPGPKGAGDVVPAMLSPGEAVIPAGPAQKYRGFIKGMISGNIPGFEDGTDKIEKIISDFRRRSRSAPDAISNQTKNMDWKTFKDEEAAMLEEVEKEIKREAKTESQARDLRNKYIGKDAAHTGKSVKQVSIGDRLVDQKVFASDVITPDARGFNQAFADLIEKRVNQKEGGKYKSGSWIGDLLNDKKRVSELANSVGMKEADLRRELKNFDPMRPGGAQYPTTKNAWKAFEAVAIGSDTTPGRIARAGLRVRNENYGREGTREAALKAGKLKYDPALDAKAAEQQENRRKNSDRRAKEAQVKGSKAKKRNTAAVSENTNAVKKDTAETKNGTQTKRDANKSAKKAKVEAAPTIKTKELLEGGITRYSGVDSRGRAYVRYTDENNLPLKNAEAEARLAGTGARTSPKGRIKGILTGLPGKLGLGALATMGVGAATGNEQISGISDQLFQAAMLSSFIPPGTMKKMKDSLGGAKDKFMKSSIGQKYAGTRMYGKFGEATKGLSDFKVGAKAEVASKGLMKALPFLAKGTSMVALRFLNVIPVVGQVALALEILYSVATINAKKQQEVSEAIVETLTMTKEKLDKVNEFFGSDAKLSGIRTATVASAGQGGGEATLAEQFRQSEQFQSLYKPQAEKLKDASKKQFMFTMQSLGLDLYAQGMSEEQVQIIIDAIKKEAGQTDLVIKFKDLKLDTEAGKANFSKAVQEIGAEVTKQFQSNRDFLGINWEAQTKLDELESQIAGFMSATSQEFVNGRMSAQEFTATSNEMYLSMVKMEQASPGDGLNFLNDVIGRLNPELQKALGFIDSLSTKRELFDLARMGIQLPQQLLNDLARDENDITANTWIKDARTWATEKNKKLSKTQKIVDGISNQQENLQDQEQNINDIYDKRIKALERINQLQDQMSKQKQNQLDLADALSRGDVFAAAQAMQKIRADQAALAVEQQKNALEDERDKKTKAINDKQEAAQDGLSSAQKDLAKVQASTFDKSYDSTLKAPDFEEVYKTFGFVYRMSRPDLWFSSDENVKVAMKNNFSSLFGAIGAVGNTGLMGPFGKLIGVAGNLVPKNANGGYISGPGSGTSDSIPARLSNGEYVIRAKAVQALGTDVLDKMNHAEKFADGGKVGKDIGGKKKKRGQGSGYIGPRPTPPFWDEDLRKYVVTQGSGDGFWQIAERYLPENRTMDSWWREVLAANTNQETGKFPKLFGNSKVIIPGYVPPRDEHIYHQWLPDKARKNIDKHGGLPIGIGGFNRTGMGGLGLNRMFANGGLVQRFSEGGSPVPPPPPFGSPDAVERRAADKAKGNKNGFIDISTWKAISQTQKNTKLSSGERGSLISYILSPTTLHYGSFEQNRQDVDRAILNNKMVIPKDTPLARVTSEYDRKAMSILKPGQSFILDQFMSATNPADKKFIQGMMKGEIDTGGRILGQQYPLIKYTVASNVPGIVDMNTILPRHANEKFKKDGGYSSVVDGLLARGQTAKLIQITIDKETGVPIYHVELGGKSRAKTGLFQNLWNYEQKERFRTSTREDRTNPKVLSWLQEQMPLRPMPRYTGQSTQSSMNIGRMAPTPFLPGGSSSMPSYGWSGSTQKTRVGNYAKGGLVKRDVTSSDSGLDWFNSFVQNLLGGGNPTSFMQNNKTKDTFVSAYNQGAKNAGVDFTDPLFYTNFMPFLGMGAIKGLKGVLGGLKSAKAKKIADQQLAQIKRKQEEEEFMRLAEEWAGPPRPLFPMGFDTLMPKSAKSKGIEKYLGTVAPGSIWDKITPGQDKYLTSLFMNDPERVQPYMNKIAAKFGITPFTGPGRGIPNLLPSTVRSVGGKPQDLIYNPNDSEFLNDLVNVILPTAKGQSPQEVARLSQIKKLVKPYKKDLSKMPGGIRAALEDMFAIHRSFKPNLKVTSQSKVRSQSNMFGGPLEGPGTYTSGTLKISDQFWSDYAGDNLYRQSYSDDAFKQILSSKGYASEDIIGQTILSNPSLKKKYGNIVKDFGNGEYEVDLQNLDISNPIFKKLMKDGYIGYRGGPDRKTNWMIGQKGFGLEKFEPNMNSLLGYAKGGLVRRDVTSSDPGINWLNDFIQNLLSGGNPSAAMQNNSTRSLFANSYTQGAKNMGVDPTDPMFYASMFAPSMGIKALGMAGKGVSKLKGLSASKNTGPRVTLPNYIDNPRISQAYLNFMRTNPAISVRMRSEQLIDKLAKKDFAYRNAFEEGMVVDDLDPRLEVENMLFGLGKDAPASSRPIYGAGVSPYTPWSIRGKASRNDNAFERWALRSKSSNINSEYFDRYGDISLLLKNRVKKRSTFTLGDSFVARKTDSLVPGGTKKTVAAPFGTMSQSKILGASTAMNRPDLQFVEAQIFGGLPFSDIKKIIVKNPEMIPLLQQKLAEAGLKIPVGQTKLSPLGKLNEMFYKNKVHGPTGLPMFIPKFKSGGMFRTPYADGGLAMLHDKEFVMNAGAVKDYGVNNLRAMNNGTYNSGSVYNSYGVNINVGGSNSNANDIARTVIREIKRLDSQNIRSTKV